MTIYSDSPVALNLLLLIPAVLVYAASPQEKASKHPAKPRHGENSDKQMKALPVRPFVTAYRGGMMMSTCLAILAVDFRIFPRRFAKVETWGTSMMDIGVGSFVFSAGLVAARPVLQARLAGQTSSIINLLLASPRTVIPLATLGFIRLYSVKGVDYAEHVTEYGVHWNFFFTLAMMAPFAALFQPVLTKIDPIAPTLALAFLHQSLVDNASVKAFVLTAPRTDFVSQNREGLFSFPGYLTLFLIGQGLGLQILPRNPKNDPNEKPNRSQRMHIFLQLACNLGFWSFFYWLSTSLWTEMSWQVSRRLANFPYICWVVAFNCGNLLIFFLIEQLCFPSVLGSDDQFTEKGEAAKAQSRVLKAFNRNGLAIFLLANLLTGLVNLTLNTLTMSRIGSMAILLTYSFTLTVVAVTLDIYNISIKL